jgi:CrcB protein
VVNFVILVLVGGGLGAMLREFVMLMVPNPVDGFPLDILVANLLAAFLLGLVTALHRWQVLSDDVNMLLGAGIMGGMSTFSSFVYGTVVLMQASTASAVVASVYVVVSLLFGYLAIIVGDKLGGQARRPNAAAAGALDESRSVASVARAVRLRRQLSHHLPHLHDRAGRLAGDDRRDAAGDRQPATCVTERAPRLTISQECAWAKAELIQAGLPLREFTASLA